MALSSCYRINPLYCDDKTACAAGLVCALPEHECRPPSEGDMGGVGGPDLSPPLGQPDLAMPAAECLTHGECAAKSPARPACVEKRCVPCFRNFHCPDSACDDDGKCHDKGKVLHVEDDMASCRRSGEPAGKPYCAIEDALGDSGLDDGTRDVILVRPSRGGGYHRNGLGHSLRKSVRLVGARVDESSPHPVIKEPFDIRPTVINSKAIAVGLEDLRITPIMSGFVTGIVCARGGSDKSVALTIRFSRIEQAPVWALQVEPGCSPVRLISSTFVNNGLPIDGGGIVTSNEVDLFMVNNVVANNGTDNSQHGGVVLGGVANATLAFNTITNNKCSGHAQQPGCNLHCRQPVTMSHSIIGPSGTSGKKAIEGPCILNHSLVPMDYTGGMDNLKNITPGFVNAMGGDYHLSPSDPMNGMLRRPAAGPLPLPFDLDGDPRPAAGVDVGADQRVP